MFTNLHCYISGRVQGVCFRLSTQEKALELGIVGWVRNLADGRVEVAARADTAKLDQFVEWLWQGPAMAKVDDIEFVQDSIQLDDTDDFVIR